jgi:hypothetical protein
MFVFKDFVFKDFVLALPQKAAGLIIH